MNLLNNNKNVICGIIGGVGPLAGVKLHEQIISNTKTNGTDQDHLNIYHISLSASISDRTNFLLSNNSVENPAIGAFNAFKILLNSTPNNYKLIIGVPCNTFHSDKIWNNFESLVNKKINNCNKNIKCNVINMIDETILYIKSNKNNIKNIGILSTEGTKNTKIYDSKLNSHNINTIYVNECLQKKLNESIYNKEWGIKSKSYPSNEAKYILIECANWLCNENVDAIILGCTELPIALPSCKNYSKYNIELIDPVEILANCFIKESLI
jgi:aspartate racemase